MMSKAETPPKPKPSSREAKLAQALRANLRRRKAGPEEEPARPAGGATPKSS